VGTGAATVSRWQTAQVTGIVAGVPQEMGHCASVCSQYAVEETFPILNGFVTEALSQAAQQLFLFGVQIGGGNDPRGDDQSAPKTQVRNAVGLGRCSITQIWAMKRRCWRL
jgi:hypothetical protein